MNLQLVKWKKFSPRRMVLSAFFLTLVQTAAARVGNIQLSKQIFLSNWTSNSQAAWSSTTMEHLAQRMSVSWSGSSSLAAGETILMILFGRKIEKYSILCIDFILPCWKLVHYWLPPDNPQLRVLVNVSAGLGNSIVSKYFILTLRSKFQL